MPTSSSFGVTQMIIMKAILTLFFVLIIGFFSFAQDAKIDSNVDTIQTEVVLTNTTSVEKVEISTENNVARLYKFKNSRIKKALAFKTKLDKAKMA